MKIFKVWVVFFRLGSQQKIMCDLAIMAPNFKQTIQHDEEAALRQLSTSLRWSVQEHIKPHGLPDCATKTF